ncbi:MAG TPA: hypothetical protein VGL53_26315 [Bryobacteraceae bacterium]|jgi:hypothetical protein
MNEWVQFRLLTVHFFRRFFDNDLLTPGADPHAVVVRALGLLATPGMMIAFYLMPRYAELAFRPPRVMAMAVRLDAMLFMTIAMSIMGFVAALEWEALFPDRTDYIILTPLPVRQRTAFTAKVASLAGFLLLFTIAINLMPGVLFPLISGTRVPGFFHSIEMMVHDVALNGAILFAGSAFIFFASMAIQGILMNGLPERWYRVASGYAQFLLMGAMVTFLLLYPRASMLLRPGQRLTMLRWYPPAWFVALSDEWMGRGDMLSGPLAHRAVLGLEWSAGLAAIFYAMAYRRYVGQSLESRQEGGRESWVGRFKEFVFARILTRHPIELGVSLFTFNTLVRSRAHKLIFEAYMGVAAALVVWELVSLFARRSYAVAFDPIPELLCIPLVLSFLLLSSMRAVFAKPSELRANWLFRLAENKDSPKGLEAAAKVMLLLGVLPVTIPLLPLHAWLWGWPVALIHLAYTALLALILRGALLLNFRKVPFTCTFAPAGPDGVVWGTVYFFIFTTYAYSMAHLEHWLFGHTWRLINCFAVLGAVLVLIEWVRRELLHEDRFLIFEDAIEPTVRTLGLGQ